MPQAINLTSIYISNLIALVMVITMLIDGRGHIINDPIENKCVNLMIFTAVTACTVDVLTFAFDGKRGAIACFIVYVGNAILFCLNLVIGPTWSTLVIHHVRGSLRKREKTIIFLLSFIGFVLIVVNVFNSIIFHVDSHNVYHRGAFYWYYITMELFFILYGSIVYFIAKSRGGILKFFPLIHFIVPILIGLTVQSKFYGVSTIHSFMTVSICCMVNSLQKECIYRDSLTGIYNRAYLDYIKREYTTKKGGVITAIMIDLNGFKSINDRFGHAVGDQALLDFAEIVRDGVGEIGSVIRYAGDEFVILLNTDKDEVVNKCIENITNGTEKLNESKIRKYEISFAIGYSSVDLKQKSVDELLNEVDKKMYINKEEFYRTNPHNDRRK